MRTNNFKCKHRTSQVTTNRSNNKQPYKKKEKEGDQKNPYCNYK